MTPLPNGAPGRSRIRPADAPAALLFNNPVCFRWIGTGLAGGTAEDWLSLDGGWVGLHRVRWLAWNPRMAEVLWGLQDLSFVVKLVSTLA